jgi:hypothetical protein
MRELALRELTHTDNLKDPVAKALEAEPFGPFPDIDVPEETLRRARAVGALVTALAHLQSTGHVLPFGRMRLGGELPEFLVMRTAGPPGYRVGDQFNFEIAEVYAPPRGALKPDLDPPLVLLDRLPARMGAKVRRVLLEAADAYRARLFVGAAMLLGTASEAAMEQLAVAILTRTNDPQLRGLLEDEMASASRLHAYTIAELAKLKVRGTHVRLLEGMANTYRELRNHAVHEPEGAFDTLLFDRTVVGPLMTGAIIYFERLYDVLDVVERGPASAS